MTVRTQRFANMPPAAISLLPASLMGMAAFDLMPMLERFDPVL